MAGKAIPATECAGDWWQYVQIGKYVIVALGDVTGHGVSSALVTAAAYGAFSISVRELSSQIEPKGNGPLSIPSPSLVIEKLVRQMNIAVQAAGDGNSTMTVVLSVIHVETGEMSTFNAAHRPVYVYRRAEKEIKKQFVVIADGRMSALGDEIGVIPEPKRFQLEAGDVIYWYTDGLIECVNPEGVRMGKNALLNTMMRAAENCTQGADSVCETLLKEFTGFLGENAKNPEDDITLAIGIVPMSAPFLKEVS